MQTPEDFLAAHGFAVRTLERTALVAAFLREMEAGLAGAPSSLGMIPAYVSPDGDVRRDVAVSVLDAGGTNLRGAVVTFPADGAPPVVAYKEKGPMPGAGAYAPPDVFYGAFAAHVRRTAPFAQAPAVGFCFSYACESAPDGDAKLLHWTKQIQAPEIIGQWVGAELKKRLGADAPARLVVLNDTVATLLAGKATSSGPRPSAYVGFILGTGTNVAYVERNENVRKVPGLPPGTMVVNAESGGFDKIVQSDFDAAMDAKTNDPGRQVLEKMIAGAYLGRLGLEVFKAAAKEGFFSPAAVRALHALETLETIDLDDFCAGVKRPNPLDAVFAAATDRTLAVRLAVPVFERAAILTAVHLAAVTLKTGGGTNPAAPVCICVDGSTYAKTRTVNFPKIVDGELKALLGQRNVAYRLAACPDDAPMIGAAVAALL